GWLFGLSGPTGAETEKSSVDACTHRPPSPRQQQQWRPAFSFSIVDWNRGHHSWVRVDAVDHEHSAVFAASNGRRSPTDGFETIRDAAASAASTSPDPGATKTKCVGAATGRDNCAVRRAGRASSFPRAILSAACFCRSSEEGCGAGPYPRAVDSDTGGIPARGRDV